MHYAVINFFFEVANRKRKLRSGNGWKFKNSLALNKHFLTPPWKPVLQMQHLHVAVRNFHFTQQLPTLFSEIFRQISLYLVTVPKSAVLNLHISFSLHCCEDDLYTSRYSGVGTKKISKSIDQGNTILHGETLTVESL